MSLIDIWAQICQETINQEPSMYIQIRKMFSNQSFDIDWEDFQLGDLPSFPQLGYKNDVSKMKQLERNYFNEEELIRIRETFLERYHSSGNKSLQTCVTARMGNKKKDSRSQGFCMQSITINHMKINKEDEIVIELHYRSTEITQKFLADLIFLRNKVIPFIMEGWPEGLTPTDIKFNFSTAYFSLMFLPVVFQFTDPVELLKDLKKHDPGYYKSVISAVSRLMTKECTYNYRTRANMHELFWEYVHPFLKKKQIAAINRLIKESGR